MKNVLIIGGGLAAIILGIFVGSEFRGSQDRSVIEQYQKSEDSFKKDAVFWEAASKKHEKEALQFKSKYDSLVPVSVEAEKKSQLFATKYENLLRHPHVFANDAERDSLLNALYPR